MPETPATSLPLGATAHADGPTDFCVWAPLRQSVAVRALAGNTETDFALQRTSGGYFQGTAPVSAGQHYWYVLDDHLTRPDPASRFQPQGVHGPSQVIDPHGFPWTDQAWQGVAKRDLVIYELHVGSFTQPGTLLALIERLPELIELGITAIELLPVTQSPGTFNWGYDGVNLFAVRNTYGHPDDLRTLVDACHAAGLAVILDVVYNHVGPEGNYLGDFGPYASRKHHTPWGDALNFDGRRRLAVRDFVVQNALYWLREYHLDGLRLDAAHFMRDESDPTIQHEIRSAVTDFEANAGRHIHLIAESNVYDAEMLSPAKAPPYDAIWSDCLMHTLYAQAAPQVHLTNRNYHGNAEIAEALQHGYLYFGDQYQRATDAHRAAFHPTADRSYLSSLVVALQTHDAVGNNPFGQRLHQYTSTDYQRAAATLVLLYPAVPMLFMGEETANAAPFPFFADFEDPKIRRIVNKGRRREYPHADHSRAARPCDESTFLASKCYDPNLADPAMRAWYQQLLAIRKQGVAEGWLTPERFETSADLEQAIFRLTYTKPTGGAVEVIVRLAPEDLPCQIQTSGKVIACSQGRWEQTTAQVELARQHALVVLHD